MHERSNSSLNDSFRVQNFLTLFFFRTLTSQFTAKIELFFSEVLNFVLIKLIVWSSILFFSFPVFSTGTMKFVNFFFGAIRSIFLCLTCFIELGFFCKFKDFLVWRMRNTRTWSHCASLDRQIWGLPFFRFKLGLNEVPWSVVLFFQFLSNFYCEIC